MVTLRINRSIVSQFAAKEVWGEIYMDEHGKLVAIAKGRTAAGAVENLTEPLELDFPDSQIAVVIVEGQ